MPGTINEQETRRRLQLIVQQIDQLPTLSSVAIRLLEATASETSHAREVIELVSSDPALSGKVLQLCGRANLGINMKNAGIDRVVILLGFDEIRSLTLAVEVFELLDGVTTSCDETHGKDMAFDRRRFWQHSLAVGVATEALVRETQSEIGTGEGFLAGLLHDLGQLTLYTVLPRTFDGLCRVAEGRRIAIDQACRAKIGVDSHTIGRHLGTHWQLPGNLVDVMWMCGQPPHSIPDGPSRKLVQLVSLADSIARHQMICHVGHGPGTESPEDWARQMGIDPDVLVRVVDSLHEEVAVRSAVLGIGELTSTDLLRESIDRAAKLDESVAEVNERRASGHLASQRVLECCDRFLVGAPVGASLTTVAQWVAASVGRMTEPGPCLVITSIPSRGRIETFEFDAAGALVKSDVHLCAEGACYQPANLPGTGTVSEVLAWSRHVSLPIAPDDPAIRLECGPEVLGGIISSIVPRLSGQVGTDIDLLRRVWGSALASATIQERANGLSEQLVEANRRLVESQEYLAAKRTMAALGELASGAAHEMNNPLAVISGRSQLLARRLTSPELRETAEEISRQARRLSDLITSLSLYSEAPARRPRSTSMKEVINGVVRAIRERFERNFTVDMEIPEDLPPVLIDRAQIVHALQAVVQNAHEANPSGRIEVRVQTDPLDDRLMIMVIDSGPGLSDHAMTHAFDPFFSEKPAGRQPGLGLARARRLIELNQGEIELRNRPEGGAVATVYLSDWRGEEQPVRSAA